MFFDGIGIGFEKNMVSEKVSVLVSKIFGIKKVLVSFWNFLVSLKVSVSVLEKIWHRKKYWIQYRKKLVSETSFGFGFVQILGFVTHWPFFSELCRLTVLSPRVAPASKARCSFSNREFSSLEWFYSIVNSDLSCDLVTWAAQAFAPQPPVPGCRACSL